jgi:hypothetical protein
MALLAIIVAATVAAVVRLADVLARLDREG